MFKKLALLIYIFQTSLLCFSQQNDNLPLLVLDDKYSELQPKDSKVKPMKYVLTSKQGFNLDCSKYDFTWIRSMNEGKKPDAVFIICKAGTYVVELDVSAVTPINKTAMHSLDPGNKEFTGFVEKDTPLLAIGTLKVENNEAKMVSYWVAMMQVK